jgi:hypothetical protein
MESHKRNIKLILWASVILAIAVAFALTRLIYPILSNAQQLTLLYIEAIKAAYQFAFVVVIGAMISWLISEYRRVQEQNEAQRDLYRKFLKEFLFAYNSAKRIRRILRARALSADKSMIKIETYNEQMMALINVQLRFEYLKKEAENTDLFLRAKDIALYLYSIESCLNDIIDEYERKNITMSNNDTYKLIDLKYLKDFIAHPRESKFFAPMFFEPSDLILEIMLKLLTKDKAEINYSNNTDVLIMDLKDEDSSIRWRAAKRLGHFRIRDPNAVDALIGTLNDDSGYVRLRAAEALGKIKDVRSIEPLKELLIRENELFIVKKEASKSIEKIEKDIDEP